MTSTEHIMNDSQDKAYRRAKYGEGTVMYIARHLRERYGWTQEKAEEIARAALWAEHEDTRE